MQRRKFIRTAGAITVGLSMMEKAALAAAGTATTGDATTAANALASHAPVANALPRWKGFNLLDFYSPEERPYYKPTTGEHFKWMRDWGFDFVRIPIAYPYYLKFDRSKDITVREVYQTDPQKLAEIDRLVQLANESGMHVSLNLHRAPGYCINAGFHEPFNLWKDSAAQEAFAFHWNLWAHRYKDLPKDKISFDLLNEPCMREDMNDQHSPSTALPGELYRKVAAAAVAAIRKENPARLIVADGNWGGSLVTPELKDLGIAQSCRGYYPHQISHYKAPWANKDPDHEPAPAWPGQVGNQYLSRAMLESFYKPWIDLVNQGIGVHCGECGCWKMTPHAVFIAWFTDVLDILKAAGIGFAPWNFIGDFGILDSGRTDVAYEDWYGHKLDRQMLELLQKH
ncbi:MAG TPA: cellulase family glycosylhydrolase [Puia sp.]|nr:cellulase family glycosylhydrolase [Puia sp.]